MKLFLIKLGKAINSLKRDGVANGAQKIASYLVVYLKNIFVFRPGDVLFITGGVGDSARFRAHNAAEELRFHGFKCSVVMADSLMLLNCADKFKIFVFCKTSVTPKIGKLIEKIKERQKEIIFDTDDLVFDARFLENADYFKNINFLEREQYKKGIGEEILSDDYVKVCTATTAYLAEKLKENSKKVFVVPNKLSDDDLKIAERFLPELSSGNSQSSTLGEIKIGYFSGTISHNKDFATITDALMEIMEKYPNVKLFLAGPLDIENKLNKLKDRIGQVPFASRKKHFENISAVDINLAPLEIGNPFCESRSELKFFEAGIVGVPTVAVANQTYREAITDGVDGFTANNTKEWVDKLNRLIENRELRIEIGKKAREKALADYTTKNSHNEEYYEYLRSHLI